MEAPADDLAAVDGVGGVIAASIATWFAEPDNRAFVEKLRAAGVDFGQPSEPAPPDEEPVLAGKAVVVTGTLDGYTREEARRRSRPAAARARAA